MGRQKKIELSDLTFQEHLKCSKDLLKAQNLIEKWNQRYERTPETKFRKKILKQMHKCLNSLSDGLCRLLDDDVCSISEEEMQKYKKKYKAKFLTSPYFIKEKKVW